MVLGDDYTIAVGLNEILSRLPGSWQCYRLFRNLYPTITREKFHPVKVGFLFCSVGTKLPHVLVSAFEGKLIKCKKIPGQKLTRLAGLKFDFPCNHRVKIFPGWIS